ncbi:hypothetical protein GE21DRAFT_1273285 [Neurospora crassa]|nr:hypothetical protein GE21DRAFT_1273285 [Neurospora crassa]
MPRKLISFPRIIILAISIPDQVNLLVCAAGMFPVLLLVATHRSYDADALSSNSSPSMLPMFVPHKRTKHGSEPWSDQSQQGLTPSWEGGHNTSAAKNRLYLDVVQMQDVVERARQHGWQYVSASSLSWDRGARVRKTEGRLSSIVVGYGQQIAQLLLRLLLQPPASDDMSHEARTDYAEWTA